MFCCAFLLCRQSEKYITAVGVHLKQCCMWLLVSCDSQLNLVMSLFSSSLFYLLKRNLYMRPSKPASPVSISFILWSFSLQTSLLLFFYYTIIRQNTNHYCKQFYYKETKTSRYKHSCLHRHIRNGEISPTGKLQTSLVNVT